MRELLVSPTYDTLVDDAGNPVRVPSDTRSGGARRVSNEELIEQATRMGCRVASIRTLVPSPQVAHAVALLRQRETHQFDPRTGQKLTYDGDSAHTEDGRTVFPRIDPAVIGIVELRGKRKILVARNRLRPQYFSLVAGYVGLGETLEQAFSREVLEETGRRIHDIHYVASQPWPVSGSLMVGFHAWTTDEEAVVDTDGELAEIRWASWRDLQELPIASSGSIAHQLISQWGRQQQEGESHHG